MQFVLDKFIDNFLISHPSFTFLSSALIKVSKLLRRETRQIYIYILNVRASELLGESLK